MMDLVNDPASVIVGAGVGFAAGYWIRTAVNWGRQSYRKIIEARELEHRGNGNAAA